MVGGDTESEKSAPWPLTGTVCGLPAAASAMLTFALRAPEAVGEKVTLIAHEAPALTLDPQVFVSEKSPLSAPVMLTLVTLTVTVEVFFNVIVWAELEVCRI